MDGGGVDVMTNIVLPYNRLVIVVFAGVVLLAIGWRSRTRASACSCAP